MASQDDSQHKNISNVRLPEDVYDQSISFEHPSMPPLQSLSPEGRKKKRDRGTKVQLEPLRSSVRMTSDDRWTLIRQNERPITDLEDYYVTQDQNHVRKPFVKPPHTLQEAEVLVTDRNGIEMHLIYDRVVAEVARNSYSEYIDGRRIWYAADGQRLNSKGHPVYTEEEMELLFELRPDLTRDSFGRSYLDD